MDLENLGVEAEVVICSMFNVQRFVGSMNLRLAASVLCYVIRIVFRHWERLLSVISTGGRNLS